MPFVEDAEFPLEVEEPESETAESESSEDLPTFDPRHRNDFTGLLYLGALTKEFTFCGHKFVIRTLRTEEILAIGLATKEYEGTASRFKALATASIAACIVSVDGKPLEIPFREEAAAENLAFRMQTIGTWSPILVDVIYSEYLALDQRVNDVFESMGKASG
jgi:hypothetical protein